jgi:hypothetical protein
MAAPVYFYYQLENFYQNHRNYVKSRDEPQLKGDSYSPTGADGSSSDHCYPLSYYKDWEGPVENPDLAQKVLYPCGLIANSFFLDNFTACVAVSSADSCDPLLGRNWQKEGIAYSSDLGKKFVSRPPFSYETNISPLGFPLPQVDDEDFVVWMRTATLPVFSKFHRQILDVSLQPGNIMTVTVGNVFNVSGFLGKKSVILTTSSVLGGKDDFLGIAFIVVAFLFGSGSAYLHIRNALESKADS